MAIDAEQVGWLRSFLADFEHHWYEEERDEDPDATATCLRNVRELLIELEKQYRECARCYSATALAGSDFCAHCMEPAAPAPVGEDIPF